MGSEILDLNQNIIPILEKGLNNDLFFPKMFRIHQADPQDYDFTLHLYKQWFDLQPDIQDYRPQDIPQVLSMMRFETTSNATVEPGEAYIWESGQEFVVPRLVQGWIYVQEGIGDVVIEDDRSIPGEKLSLQGNNLLVGDKITYFNTTDHTIQLRMGQVILDPASRSYAFQLEKVASRSIPFKSKRLFIPLETDYRSGDQKETISLNSEDSSLVRGLREGGYTTDLVFLIGESHRRYPADRGRSWICREDFYVEDWELQGLKSIPGHLDKGSVSTSYYLPDQKLGERQGWLSVLRCVKK